MQVSTDFDVRHQLEFGNQFNETPIAGKGPNMGHNTPTNVFAWDRRAD